MSSHMCHVLIGCLIYRIYNFIYWIILKNEHNAWMSFSSTFYIRWVNSNKIHNKPTSKQTRFHKPTKCTKTQAKYTTKYNSPIKLQEKFGKTTSSRLHKTTNHSFKYTNIIRRCASSFHMRNDETLHIGIDNIEGKKLTQWKAWQISNEGTEVQENII
jgi:hypothetical protein